MLSHVLPYLLYVAPAGIAAFVPESLRPWLGPAGVAGAAAALVFHARRGAYPELRRTPAARPRAALLAVLSGLAVAAVWMPLSHLGERLGVNLGSRGGFDPAAAGDGFAPALWTFRVAGFVAVVPFAEELFVRSLVPRWTDAPDDWRSRAVGAFTPLSAAVSIVFFTGTHPEVFAALATAALWTALLASTRRLTDCVVAHAVANAALAAAWIAAGDRSWW